METRKNILLEEKERFELLEDEEELGCAIRDNNSNKIYCVTAWHFYDLRELLNQQDRRIKELEEELVYNKDLAKNQ